MKPYKKSAREGHEPGMMDDYTKGSEGMDMKKDCSPLAKSIAKKRKKKMAEAAALEEAGGSLRMFQRGGKGIGRGFDEAKHPRIAGKFAKKGGGVAGFGPKTMKNYVYRKGRIARAIRSGAPGIAYEYIYGAPKSMRLALHIYNKRIYNANKKVKTGR